MRLPFVLARRFVAGETLDAAMPAVQRLRSEGLLTSLDLLGEDVTVKTQAAAYTDEYIRILERLAREDSAFQANISIKLSMIGQRIDADYCAGNLRRLLEIAKSHEAFVRLDMEGSDLTQSTLDIFESVYPDFRENVGVVLQAYLHRTDHDVDRIIELGARCRLCKGAYKEPSSIAHQDMDKIRAQYTSQMQRLLSHGRYPAFATHDDSLIEAIQSYTRTQRIDTGAFEFQMLYGIRPDTQQALARDGYNMRVYIPFGTDWLPYFTRRIRERKENAWFVLRNLFRS